MPIAPRPMRETSRSLSLMCFTRSSKPASRGSGSACCSRYRQNPLWSRRRSLHRSTKGGGMTSLQTRSLDQVRDRIAASSAAEVIAESIEAARGIADLGAFIALADRADGRGRSAGRRPARGQGQPRHPRLPHHRRHPGLAGLAAGPRPARRRAPARRRGRCGRQDQPARAGARDHQQQRRVRPGPQPARPEPVGRRLVRGVGGRRGHRRRPDRPGDRHRRVGAGAGGALRRGRLAADRRALGHRPHRPDLAHPRHRRCARHLRRRRRRRRRVGHR